MDEGNPLILKEEAPEIEEEESGFSGIFVSCSEGEEDNFSRSRYVLQSSSVTDPDPHQTESRYHPDPDQSDKLDPDPHHVEDDKPKCMEYEPFYVLFQDSEPLFGR
jgi:hypothetical protein